MRPTSSEFFDETQRKRLDEAVKGAEEKSSGELVPVLATSADTYDGGLFLAGLMLAGLVTLALFGFFFLPLEFLAYDPWDIPLYMLLPCQLVALLVGYHAARAYAGLHRTFVPRAYMQQRVDMAAHQAFRMFHLTHTEAATGILIYVSLFERMVVVLADKAINEKHDQSTWDGVRNRITRGFSSSDPARGFEDAITECGRILAEDFPIREGDTNELPNHLRLV